MPGQHQIPFDTGEEERLLGPLSISATLWLAGGAYLSYEFARALPPLPLPNLFAYIHYVSPLLFAALMAFVKYKDLTIMQYIMLLIRFRRRKRKLPFVRYNPINELSTEEDIP